MKLYDRINRLFIGKTQWTYPLKFWIRSLNSTGILKGWINFVWESKLVILNSKFGDTNLLGSYIVNNGHISESAVSMSASIIELSDVVVNVIEVRSPE